MWIQDQYIARNLSKINKEMGEIKQVLEEVKHSPLKDLSLWMATITKLSEAWIKTLEELSALSDDEIKEILKNPLQIKSVLNSLNR